METKVILGQWMVLNKTGKLFQATEMDVQYPKSTLEQATTWKPQEGDWCWFWTEHSGVFYMNFGKYSKFIDGKHEGFGVNGNSYLLSEKVEPFIGELPTKVRLKEKV